jgi:isopentenyldiphosphate isomerase
MYDKDELLDLVDIEDQVVMTVERGEYYAHPEKYEGLNLRAADLFIQNYKGELWIPRRTMDRKIAPGGLDYSCGGHVGSGERYIDGLIREIAEEINLDLKPQDLTLLMKFGPRPNLPYYSEMYLYKTNTAPQFNTDDFDSGQWILPADLVALLQSGTPAKTSILESLQTVIDKL